MSRMIAFCGVICSKCPVFIATQENNTQQKKEIAESWSKKYGFELQSNDINCDGCLTEGERLFQYCKVCKIRECCRERYIENCAYCSDFVCNKLETLFNALPHAKVQLQRIKASL